LSKKILVAACAAAALMGMGGAASAASLYNTGFDASGNEIVGVGVDAHWTITGGTGTGISGSSAYTSASNGVWPVGPWVSEDGASRWITPTRTAADSFDPRVDGTYQYSQSFNLTSGQAALASFTGQFAADNRVDWIKLNGVTIYSNSLGGSDFENWTSFGDTSHLGFLTGLNTLTFDVVNYGQDGGNPSGLDVRFDTTPGGAAGVPEPATWATLLVGFLGLGAMLRRRSAATVLAR
jgi:hypothetical protein